MSAGNIDKLLMLWKASGGEPFVDHVHIYNIIDAIPIGGVSWQKISVSYNGPQPKPNVLP